MSRYTHLYYNLAITRPNSASYINYKRILLTILTNWNLISHCASFCLGLSNCVRYYNWNSLSATCASVFILLSRNNECHRSVCLQTLRHQYRSVLNTEVSQDTSALGPKCPDQFGISAEVHFVTRSLQTLRHQYRSVSTLQPFRHWYRNILGSKCLGTEVSGNPLYCPFDIAD